MAATVSTMVGADGTAVVTLDRPERHNAFDEAMIAELTAALDAVGGRADVRIVLLAAAGKSFSAGADLDWMRRMAAAGQQENEADALRLARLLDTLDRLPKPTIATVQGAAYGGGVGLVAACDLALAAEGATFSLSEVKLGLVPAVISPYVIAAVGPRWARRLILTGERFDAGLALRLGLVHEIVAPERLMGRAGEIATLLAEGAPTAQAEAKLLIDRVSGRRRDATLMAETASIIARVRAGEEAREGVAAFLERRRPSWHRR